MAATRAALIQVESPSEEPVDERRRRVSGIVRELSDVDLIVLPELWAVGYASFDSYERYAEPFLGPTVSSAVEWARDLAAYVNVGTFVERDANGQLFNTSALIDPSGTVIGTFRKIHIFGYQSREPLLVQPGKTLMTASTRFGTVSTAVCYDLRFPDLWQAMLDAGAESVVVPAAWPAARLDHWNQFVAVRAIEEQIAVIACNAVGTHGGMTFAGHSKVVDPWGTVLAEAGDDECVLRCDIDISVVAAARRQFPVLTDRLPSYACLHNPHA